MRYAENINYHAGVDEFSSSARMNQLAPDFMMVKRLGSVPTSFFYEENDDIAAMLMLNYRFGELNKQK